MSNKKKEGFQAHISQPIKLIHIEKNIHEN